MSAEKNWPDEADTSRPAAKVGTTRIHEKALQATRVGNASLLVPHMLKAARSNPAEIEAFVQKLRDACVDTSGTAAVCLRTANIRRNIFARQMSRGIDTPPEPPTFKDMLELHFLELTPFEFLNFLEELDRQFQVAVAKSDNGKMLAPEGREIRQKQSSELAERVVKIYRRVRRSMPTGRKGNGRAIAEVCDQIGSLPGKDKPITSQWVRKLLKSKGQPLDNF